ncbi:MAG: hypothetical protein QOJ46_2702 [bacterium]|jgi:quercetin dioxygenase-like cupin family protein
METICGATFSFGLNGDLDLIENELTGGSYRLMVASQLPAGEGPPLHTHPHTDEGFYVGDGEVTFVFPDREVKAGAGSFVFIPRGVEHTAHVTQGPVHGLLIFSPGDAEHVTVPVETA